METGEGRRREAHSQPYSDGAIGHHPFREQILASGLPRLGLCPQGADISTDRGAMNINTGLRKVATDSDPDSEDNWTEGSSPGGGKRGWAEDCSPRTNLQAYTL